MRLHLLAYLMLAALLAASLGAAAGPVETAHHWRNVATRAAMNHYDAAKALAEDAEVPSIDPNDLPSADELRADAEARANAARAELERNVPGLPPLPGAPPLPAVPGADGAVAKGKAIAAHWSGFVVKLYEKYT